MPVPKILVFAGSIRTGSYNARLAALAAKELALTGADVTRISLEDYPLPIYDGDDEAKSGRAGERAQPQADVGGASGRVHREPRIQRLDHAAAEEHHRLDFARARARRAAAGGVQEPRLRDRRRVRRPVWRAALADGAAPGAGARLRRAGDAGADHGVSGERGIRRDGQSEGRARRRFAQARGRSGSPKQRGRWRDGCARPSDRGARPAVGRRRRGDGGKAWRRGVVLQDRLSARLRRAA